MKNRYFLAARAVALSSTGKFRHGAVLVKKGRIYAARCNSYSKTHPALAKYTEWPFLHAETGVCIASERQREGADVYVVRLDRKGNMCLSRPCDVCQAFMKSVGINNAFYSIKEGEYGVMEL